MIYTDNVGHMVADSLEELHDFAKELGLKREWFQDHPRHPHYDLTTQRMRNKALRLGAQLADRREIVKTIKRCLENGRTSNEN